MAYYSNFHHSNHPNFPKQPYGGRPHRSPRGGNSDQGGYPPMGGDMGPTGGPGGYSNGSGSYGGGHMGGGGGGPRGGGYQNGGGAGGNSGNTLWMGNIDDSMDEQFIQFAFTNLGVNIQNVKIIRNKDTGAPVGYGFITFEDRNSAQNVLRELNGKKIPNVEEDKRFFLKPANRQAGGGGPGGPGGAQRFSIFVGNLTPDINDEILYQAFFSYYPSVSSAKVITSDGQSKGYGFVTFENEYDYQTALSNPNMMLGQTPISISRARHSTPGGKNPRFQNDGNGGPQDNMNVRSRRQQY